jgi:hypothetical protein
VAVAVAVEPSNRAISIEADRNPTALETRVLQKERLAGKPTSGTCQVSRFFEPLLVRFNRRMASSWRAGERYVIEASCECLVD